MKIQCCSIFSLVIIVVATGTATVEARDVSSSSSSSTKRRMEVTIPNIRDDIVTAGDALESFRLWQSTFMESPIMFSSSTSKIQNYTNTLSLSSYETIYQNHQLWIGRSTTNAIEVSNDIWIVIHSDSKTTSTQNIHNQQKQVFLGLPGQEFLQPIFPEEFISTNNKNNNILQRQVLVHEGYHNEMFHNQDMYPKIMNILQPWIDTSKTTIKNTNTVLAPPLQIHWIGTSIGGAMTMLAGTYFAYHHPTIPTYVRTYRQPRCGNQAFAALVGSIIPNLNIWRIVYQHDWETQRPFQSQYYHTGHLLWRRQQQQQQQSNQEQKQQQKGVSNTKDSNFQTEAYFRTMGNPALGYAGIQDYSIWMNEGEINHMDDTILVDMSVWLESAATFPNTYFVHDFLRTSSS